MRHRIFDITGATWDFICMGNRCCIVLFTHSHFRMNYNSPEVTYIKVLIQSHEKGSAETWFQTKSFINYWSMQQTKGIYKKNIELERSY